MKLKSGKSSEDTEPQIKSLPPIVENSLNGFLGHFKELLADKTEVAKELGKFIISARDMSFSDALGKFIEKSEITDEGRDLEITSANLIALVVGQHEIYLEDGFEPCYHDMICKKIIEDVDLGFCAFEKWGN